MFAAFREESSTLNLCRDFICTHLEQAERMSCLRHCSSDDVIERVMQRALVDTDDDNKEHERRQVPSMSLCIEKHCLNARSLRNCVAENCLKAHLRERELHNSDIDRVVLDDMRGFQRPLAGAWMGDVREVLRGKASPHKRWQQANHQCISNCSNGGKAIHDCLKGCMK